MKSRSALALWTQRTFWGIYPVALYYGMVALERSVDLRRYLGPDPLGSKVIKLFIFAGASMLLFGWVGGVLEYLERRSAIHPQLARVLYQPLIYPLEYFWFSFPLAHLRLDHKLLPAARREALHELMEILLEIRQWLAGAVLEPEDGIASVGLPGGIDAAP